MPLNSQPLSFYLINGSAVCLLLLCSAFISGAEAALFSLSDKEKELLNKSRHKNDKLVVELLKKPNYLLATILIANNLVNVAFVTVSTFAFWDIWGRETSNFLLTGLIVVTSAFIAIFGEVIPKVFAAQKNLITSQWVAFPMQFIIKFFYPFSWILVKSSSFIKMPLPTDSNKQLTKDDLHHAIDLTLSKSSATEERELLKGFLKFGNTSVKKIMKPRQDIKFIERTLTLPKVLELINQHGYSRLPVVIESLDQIEGILLIKDLIQHTNQQADFPWQKLLKPAFFIPESKKIDDLLNDFKKSHNHLAIVVDEYGGTSGIITLEDILEEIVGDINDEFDNDDMVYSRLDDNTFTFEGKTSIKDFCRITEISPHLFENQKSDFESIGGLLLNLFSRMPKIGEVTFFENLEFIIESVDVRRIKRVKVKVKREIEKV